MAVTWEPRGPVRLVSVSGPGIRRGGSAECRRRGSPVARPLMNPRYMRGRHRKGTASVSGVDLHQPSPAVPALCQKLSRYLCPRSRLPLPVLLQPEPEQTAESRPGHQQPARSPVVHEGKNSQRYPVRLTAPPGLLYSLLVPCGDGGCKAVQIIADQAFNQLRVDRGRGAGQGRAMDGVPLDALVARMLSMSPFDYRVAVDDSEREVAYRLRGSAVVDRGWCVVDDVPGGMERDDYDDRAVQVIGWDRDVAMSTGRVVLPPGLPTEEACGIVVEPRGSVVDVGRMCVARSHQSLEHAAFVGLMCRLYLVMRGHGFGVACGMMSTQARLLVGHLGLRLEVLGPERMYWNESRAPVRFSLMSGADPFAKASGQLAHPQAARTSAVFAPPKPNELDNA